MKLVVPHIGSLQESDARLIRLAQFLGITCEPLLLDKQAQNCEERIGNVPSEQASCFVVNPRVFKEWTGSAVPAELVSCLTSHFPYLLVHSLTTDPFCDDLIKALSAGRLHSVRPISDAGQLYEIATDCRQICGPFSGVSFGPVNPVNDRIISVNTDNGAVRTPISIGGSPFMVAVKQGDAEILLLASTDTLDANYEIGNASLSEYFSRFVPHAMALRYIFGESCWQPGEHHASFTIDDPLLRPNYGFLNFESLLRLMEEYNFCTTIAFIPHNYRRNSSRIVQMFREKDRRLAICYHGNDHTAEEFASSDTSRLNTLLGIAEARMDIHQQATGLPCQKVMVFPQEYFSVEAMKVLKSRNFCAAVCSTPHPAHHRVALTLGELAQPAILRHGGFPLFLRKYVQETKRQDIAFNLFFGRPVLVVDHHEVFKQPEALLGVVSMINSMAPDIRWSDLKTAVANSVLRRTEPDGSCHIRAYSGTVRIANDRHSLRRYLVAWNHFGQCPSVEQVLQGGTPSHSFEADDCGIRISVELTPGSSQALSLVYRNNYSSLAGLGFRWNAKAYLRRRICELRDNYISKNHHATALAEALRRRVSS